MLFVRVLFLFVTSFHVTKSSYVVPDVTIEVLKKGGFRVHIPDVTGTSEFGFHANINERIKAQEKGSISKETKIVDDQFWVLEFYDQLQIGDEINYWILVKVNRLAYKNKQCWTVKKLLDSYTTLKKVKCVTGSTVINGGKSTCVGDSIINDDFTGQFLDKTVWTIEHRIPTYVGPNYYFNSFINTDETRFIRDGVLYFKPKAIPDDKIRGTLDLTEGCTSTDNDECFYESMSTFLLPPVKSAKIVSKATFQYGKIEIRAKLPEGDWIVPILQLEPAQRATASPSNIIIAYSRGNKVLNFNPLIDVRFDRSDSIGSRLLLGGPSLSPEEPMILAQTFQNQELNEAFHNYKLEWTPGRIKCYLDGIEFGSVDIAPYANFNQEYILGIGVAVGGIIDFPDGIISGNDQKPWSNADRNYIKSFFENKGTWLKTWIGNNCALQIDYVKVTAL